MSFKAKYSRGAQEEKEEKTEGVGCKNKEMKPERVTLIEGGKAVQ